MFGGMVIECEWVVVCMAGGKGMSGDRGLDELGRGMVGH